MITEIIKQWDERKHLLEQYFSQTDQDEYSSYADIVKKIFEYVIISSNEYSNTGFDIKKMRVIDDGNYQGTQIFIIPKDTYQPDMDDYIMTHTYYGSCSGCDTLQSICSYDDGLPTEEQVKEYMTLALHLIQKMKYLSE